MSRHSSKGSARRPPGEQVSSPDAKDAEWGFEQQEPERVLEPKLGIVLVTGLVLMFGFVLYQKLQSTPTGGSQHVSENRQNSTDDDESDPAIAEDGTDFTARHAAENAQSAPAPDQGTFNPFLTSESSAPRTAHGRRTTRTDVEDGSDPFASPPNPFASEADQAAEPPPQREPPPFGERAQHDSSAFGSAESLDAELYFEDEPASPPNHRSSAAFEGGSWPEHGHASSMPSAKPDHELVQQFDVSPPGGPNPFAAPPPSRAQTFNSPRRDSHQQEPQAFPSDELAVPVPPQQQEPDPFGYAESPSGAHDREDAAQAEENPFFDVPASDEAAGRYAPAGSDWERSGADFQSRAAELSTPGTDERSERIDPGSRPFVGFETPSRGPKDPHGDTTMIRDVPELPALPAAVPDRQGAGESVWNVAPARRPLPALPSVEVPELKFAPMRGQHNVGSGPSVAGAQVPVVGEREIPVRRNDSLWSISREAYGTARYVPALTRYNRDRVPHPNKLRVGVKIRIPPPEVLEARFPELFGGSGRRDAAIAPAGGASSHPRQPRQVGLFVDSVGRPHYRVGKNDTLIQLARRYLGRATRWTEIFDMNRHQLKNAESLKPGMVLRMPADAGSVAVFNERPPSR